MDCMTRAAVECFEDEELAPDERALVDRAFDASSDVLTVGDTIPDHNQGTSVVRTTAAVPVHKLPDTTELWSEHTADYASRAAAPDA